MNYKKVLMVIIAIISVILIYKLPRLLINKSNMELPEVKLVKLKEKIEKEKSFAIMVSNDESNYQEYDSDTWPDNSYKFKEAKCIDNKGELAEGAITFENGKATLTTDKTIYCTLYFDHKKTIEILKENDLNSTLSKEEVGGIYRYQGTEEVPNWICFGTEDNCGTNEDLIDKYMYRIIGITKDGKIKLIKETYIKENDNTLFVKNDKYSIDPTVPYYCDNGECPEWNNSKLFKRLNGISNGTTIGSGSYINKADTDIFVDSVQYDYLRSGDSNGGDTPSEWYNLIEENDWMYGDSMYGDATDNPYNGDVAYQIETGQKETNHNIGPKENVTEQAYTWTKSVKAKIGLQYMHDYLYATPGGNPKNRETAKNAWIYFQKDGYNSYPDFEKLLPNYGIYNFNVANSRNFSLGSCEIYKTGGLSKSGDFALSDGGGIRPVFYLSSKTKIKNNKGTKQDPFIIDI